MREDEATEIFVCRVDGAERRHHRLKDLPPILRQWKVDEGSGFVAVSASATNSVLIITNARIADTGRYALFGTNGVAGTNTTSVRLVVIEGVD